MLAHGSLYASHPGCGAPGLGSEPLKVGDASLSDTSLSTDEALTSVGSYGSGSSLGCPEPSAYEFAPEMALGAKAFEPGAKAHEESRPEMPSLAPPPGLEQPQAEGLDLMAPPRAQLAYDDLAGVQSAYAAPLLRQSSAPEPSAVFRPGASTHLGYDPPLLRQSSEDSNWLSQLQMQQQMHLDAATHMQQLQAAYLQQATQAAHLRVAAGLPFWPQAAAGASPWPRAVPAPANERKARKGSPKQAASERPPLDLSGANLEVPSPAPPPATTVAADAPARPAPSSNGETGISPGLHCDSESTGAFRVRWAVESRKLKSNDKSIVSAPFEVPALAPATFKIVVAARQVSDSKGGNSFRKAKGIACVQLKCQTEPEASQADMKFKVNVEGQGLSEALDCQHDFRQSPLCTCLETFNFSSLLATETSQMLVISLEFQREPEPQGSQ